MVKKIPSGKKKMKPMKTMERRPDPRRGPVKQGPSHSSVDNDEECIGLRFFKLLLQPDFSSKLKLPRALCEYFMKKRSKVRATLASSHGKLWHVDLYRENRDVYMGGEGWSECVEANDIRLGYLLIMCYKGRKIFSFRVFDFSSFEIQNPAIKRRLIAERQNNGGSMDSSSEETGHTAWRSSCPMKAYFDVTFKKYMFVARVLTIPHSFRRASGLTEEHEEVSIVGLDGITRQVGLSHQGRAMRLSREWTRFVRENGIDAGQRVRFELVSSSHSKKVVKMRMILLQASSAEDPETDESQGRFIDDSDDNQIYFDDDSDP